MFVGREEELKTLERLYERKEFQMVVVYGRRRVGKTTLIDHFVREKPTLYFTAKIQSSMLNLKELTERVCRFFDLPASTPPFASWAAAFGFLAEKSRNNRFVFVFDELPYAAQVDPSLPSVLQAAIDHGFKQGGAFVILCGSNEGFMESEVLGRKSPLYGRRTGQIRLSPFDYRDASLMLSGTSPEEAIRYYATFGGTPYYLEQINPELGYKDNIARSIFDKSGVLYEEPMMLLRQELREPATYNSILLAIAHGATEPARIADWAGVNQNSVGKYLRTLIGLGLVERRVPFGENPGRSRNGIYSLSDPFFSFWYRFVGPAVDAIELGAGESLAASICASQALPTYEGLQFERICLQWVALQNKQGKLPFLATSFGKWWGTDPSIRETVAIDLVAANKTQKALLCGECKWRNSFDESEALRVAKQRSLLISGKWERRYVALFSKRPLSMATREKVAGNDGVLLVSGEDLFK